MWPVASYNLAYTIIAMHACAGFILVVNVVIFEINNHAYISAYIIYIKQPLNESCLWG